MQQSNVDGKSVLLKINLELVDSSGSVAKVNQDIMLPHLREPAFIKGAYRQIEDTLNLVGVDFFKRLVRQYCLAQASAYYSPQINEGAMLPEFKDDKIVISSDENQPIVSSNIGVLGVGDNQVNVADGNPQLREREEMDLDLEVEEESNETKGNAANG